jgi:hypothetical protein
VRPCSPYMASAVIACTVHCEQIPLPHHSRGRIAAATTNHRIKGIACMYTDMGPGLCCDGLTLWLCDSAHLSAAVNWI